MPDLTFTQPHPGGRILLHLGQHQIGAKEALIARAQDWLAKAGVA